MGGSYTIQGMLVEGSCLFGLGGRRERVRERDVVVVGIAGAGTAVAAGSHSDTLVEDHSFVGTLGQDSRTCLGKWSLSRRARLLRAERV